MRTIRGKRAVVTGAASGIGRAIALELAKEGAHLFLIDIDKEKLGAAAREMGACGVQVITAVCDLAQPAQISDAVSELHRTWNDLNILVNCAGVAYYGPTRLMTDQQWRRIMAVNLMAPIQLTMELFPALLSADDAHILNVCSLFGLVTTRKATLYQTTKFGLVGLTAALRTEYCRPNFGVTALCPGFVDTPLLDEDATSHPVSRLRVPSWIRTSPEKVAVRAIRAIRKNEGLVMTPLAHLCWWTARLSPALVDWLTREGWRRKGKIDL